MGLDNKSIFTEADSLDELRRRMRWAQLIKRVWLEDPLLCPECGGGMRIISFITDPPVVDKILRHIEWHSGKQMAPYIRPPPKMLKDNGWSGFHECSISVLWEDSI